MDHTELKTNNFDSIINNLNIELDKLKENSNVIYKHIENIQSFNNDITHVNFEKVEERRTVVEDLWNCVELLQEYNSELSESRQALNKLVG